MAEGEEKCKECRAILQQFIIYKQNVVGEKEQMRRELEKYKQQLDKFVSKVDKKIETRAKQQRNVSNHRLDELQQLHSQEQDKLKSLLSHKDRIIDQLRQLVRMLQTQKRQLVQNNTKVLVELSQGIDCKEQHPSEAIDSNYKELMKMYQFLIEENNQLKKDIYLLQRHNLAHSQVSLPSHQGHKNESFVLNKEKDDKSINNSEYKPRSVLERSKGEGNCDIYAVNCKKEKGKEKSKKPPLQKGAQKVKSK